MRRLIRSPCREAPLQLAVKLDTKDTKLQLQLAPPEFPCTYKETCPSIRNRAIVRAAITALHDEEQRHMRSHMRVAVYLPDIATT